MRRPPRDEPRDETHAVRSRDDLVQALVLLGVPRADAAMFVSVSPAALAGALLQLVATPDEGPLAANPVRAGLAGGLLLPRAGDFFGEPVNLAARLTDRARPGTALASEDLGDALAQFTLHRVPPMRLRGLGMRRPYRVQLPPV